MSDIKSWADGSLGTATLDEGDLGDEVRMQLLRDAVRMYESNQRQGNHSTKTRAEIQATGAKPYKQKGTGNARRGDFASPILRGGGVTFGPRPRDYSYKMPRKALREALRSALLGKLRDDEISSLASKGFDAPSTKRAAKVLADLGCEGSTAIVLENPSDAIFKSFRNLPRVSVIPARELNPYHVLWHRNVVLVDGAWNVLMGRLTTTTENAES